jgi:hypothetical protein
MLLHLPAEPMTPENFVDTRSSRTVLDDMCDAVWPPLPPPHGKPPKGWGVAVGAAPVQVFKHDIYTVLLAQNAADIPEALARVPEQQRIQPNPAIFDFYMQHYPRYPVALCCFDNREAAQAAPLLLWYRPLNPDLLEMPAIDSHTGAAPELADRVAVDHRVIIGTDDRGTRRSRAGLLHPVRQRRHVRKQRGPGGQGPARQNRGRGMGVDEIIASSRESRPAKDRPPVAVHYKGRVSRAVRDLLPQHVVGLAFGGTLLNGDFVAQTHENSGVTTLLRRTPAGQVQVGELSWPM